MCFFFNDTATTEIYTLSLHDALPISSDPHGEGWADRDGDQARAAMSLCFQITPAAPAAVRPRLDLVQHTLRSEEHTSELQSRQYLVCRLLLEKKKYHTLLLNTAHNRK